MSIIIYPHVRWAAICWPVSTMLSSYVDGEGAAGGWGGGGGGHRFGYWSDHSVGCLISVSSHSLLVLARPLCLIRLRLASSFVLRWQCLVGSVHVQIELLTCLITVCCLSRLSSHGFGRFSVALTCVVVTWLTRTFAHAWMNAHNFRRQNISTGMSKY